jgi:hypothetical protein
VVPAQFVFDDNALLPQFAELIISSRAVASEEPPAERNDSEQRGLDV